MTYSGSPYSGEAYSGSSSLPFTPASIGTAATIPGPVDMGTNLAVILPASIPSRSSVTGPQPVPNPVLLGPIKPAAISSGSVVPGPFIAASADDDDATAPFVMRVKDHPHASEMVATPMLNDPGTGSYTEPRSEMPNLGDIIGFNVKGRRIFTGIATGIEDVALDQSYEVGQVAKIQAPGLLDEWRHCVVLPDYGAQDVTRLGPPTQDSRIFDWTMNGGQGDLGPSLSSSYSADGRYGRDDELFPLPDVWPDPTARWMWATPPAQNAPRGYCHFRVPFSASGKVQVWACAHDYADVWMDGVQVLTCDTPGVAQRLELDIRSDFHLLTIRGYNAGGRAGILASVLPVESDGLYGEPFINSRGGWKVLAYPRRTFRLNPGRILKRLHLEAQRRGVPCVGDWELDFTETRDSAGRPWPANAPVTIEVGMTYLDVLRRLAEDLIDFAPSPSGRRLRAWVKDKGTGTNRALPWDAEVDQLALVTSRGTG